MSAAAGFFSSLVENAGNGRVRKYNASGRPNNRTRRSNSRPAGAMPYVVEDADINVRRPPAHGSTVNNIARLPRMPYVVEDAPRGLPTTPGYGHLDYSKMQNWGETLAETDIELTNYEDIVRGVSPLPAPRKVRSFDDSGRYMVAYTVLLHTGSDYMGFMVLIDNHGQKHQQRHTNKRFLIDNINFPTPLPDVLIDQIKHMAYMIDEQFGPQTPDISWSPVDHIASLSASR
jgi:hypothetical protein